MKIGGRSYILKWLLALPFSMMTSCQYHHEINTNLYGSWTWQQSVGSISGDDVRTPQSTGESVKLTFGSNSIYIRTDNDIPHLRDSFKLSIEQWGGAECKFLTLYEGYDTTRYPGTTIRLRSKYLVKRLSDVLVIWNIEVSDGYVDTYVRELIN